MDIYCYEPGLHGVFKSLVVAQATDRLIFPHVDSCMALCLILKSGATVGGHVPMQMGADAPLQPANNAQFYLGKMLTELAGLQPGGAAAPPMLVTCGDERSATAGGMGYGIAALGARVGGRHLHLEATGLVVNVFADGPNRMFTVTDSERGDQVIYSVPFGHLQIGQIQLHHA